MATTTNFGWETPDDTDLVKDGAAAIRTLGGAIDTSLVDLKGGTTGQLLSKNSNTDMDFTWAAAGIPATIVDAKGDLIAATAADTVSRLAIGTNNQVLTADSTAATGMKWATPTTTFVGCSLSKSAGQSINTSTNTAITFNQEAFDTDGFHDNTTNTSRITIPSGKAGKYLFSAQIYWGVNVPSTNYVILRLYKNGVEDTVFTNNTQTSAGQRITTQLTTILDLIATDYIEIYGFHNASSAQTIGTNGTFFQCQYLGA